MALRSGAPLLSSGTTVPLVPSSERTVLPASPFARSAAESSASTAKAARRQPAASCSFQGSFAVLIVS